MQQLLKLEQKLGVSALAFVQQELWNNTSEQSKNRAEEQDFLPFDAETKMWYSSAESTGAALPAALRRTNFHLLSRTLGAPFGD